MKGVHYTLNADKSFSVEVTDATPEDLKPLEEMAKQLAESNPGQPVVGWQASGSVIAGPEVELLSNLER